MRSDGYEMEVRVALLVIQTLSRAAGKMVSTLRLGLHPTQLGSLVIASLTVLLSVTLPGGGDTQSVRTPGMAS